MSTGKRGMFFMFNGPATFEHRGYNVFITSGGASIKGDGWDFTLPHNKTPWDKLENLASLTQKDLVKIADLVVAEYDKGMKNMEKWARDRRGRLK